MGGVNYFNKPKIWNDEKLPKKCKGNLKDYLQISLKQFTQNLLMQIYTDSLTAIPSKIIRTVPLGELKLINSFKFT